jgi:hypothetical protein
LEEVPDAAGEVSLEAAHGFEAGLAFGAFAGEVVAGLGVAAGAGERDAVNGSVELAVAAAVKPMAVGLAGADRDWGDAGGAGEFGLRPKAARAGDLAEQLGRGQGPEAGLAEQLRRGLVDEVGDLGLELVGGDGEFAQPPQFVAGDPNARGLLGARQAPRDPRRPTSLRTTRCRAT